MFYVSEFPIIYFNTGPDILGDSPPVKAKCRPYDVFGNNWPIGLQSDPAIRLPSSLCVCSYEGAIEVINAGEFPSLGGLNYIYYSTGFAFIRLDIGKWYGIPKNIFTAIYTFTGKYIDGIPVYKAIIEPTKSDEERTEVRSIFDPNNLMTFKTSSISMLFTRVANSDDIFSIDSDDHYTEISAWSKRYVINTHIDITSFNARDNYLIIIKGKFGIWTHRRTLFVYFGNTEYRPIIKVIKNFELERLCDEQHILYEPQDIDVEIIPPESAVNLVKPLIDEPIDIAMEKSDMDKGFFNKQETYDIDH